jgi:hypothetical protein
MTGTRKVYDYNQNKVRRILQSALRENAREASQADLVARTGLPTYQVEQTLRIMLDEQSGQVKATESGELLYYFPNGFRNRKKGVLPRLRQLGFTVGRGTGISLVVLFKIWIVSMLVGYFVLFVLLLLAALVASVAGSAASRNTRTRSRGGGFGSFYLGTRLVQIFISLWMYSSAGKKRKLKSRPLHQTVFAYVFGEEDPEKGWESYLRKTSIRYIQSSKGVISLDELIRLTGKSPSDAGIMMNEMLREYEGSPQATDNGTIYYQFPSLMTTTEKDPSSTRFTANRKELKRFNSNPKKTNRWIAFFNGFNLIFGSYFLYYSLSLPIEPTDGFARFFLIVGNLLSNIGNPLGFMLFGLGMVPVLFSFVFFLATGIRRLGDRRQNRRIRRENFRRTVFEAIGDQPEYVLPGAIIPRKDAETPRNWEALRDEEIEGYASFKGADIQTEADSRQYFAFDELKREQTDMATLRASIDTDRFGVGQVVFDSGDD